MEIKIVFLLLLLNYLYNEVRTFTPPIYGPSLFWPEGSGININELYPEQLEEPCIDGPSWGYNGDLDRTKSGQVCQRWDVNIPHKVRYHPPDNDTHHNFCRNPDRDVKGTWCYTINPAIRWEYCSIPKCDDDSIVLFTSYQPETDQSKVLSMIADQELHYQQIEKNAVFESFKVVMTSQRAESEFWSVAGDYDNDRVFYTDYKNGLIGTLDLLTNETREYLHGMGRGIESIAFDWKRGNLYWTDSTMKWIMVANEDFSHYTPVYRSINSDLFGIALHVKSRRIFFSAYESMLSEIISIDMAGGDFKVLFEFPEVYDVTGLTVDYTDDRLYWTDFDGVAGIVCSSDLDGTNVVKHFYRRQSQFSCITSYKDYLFVTDTYPFIDTEASHSEWKEVYYIWVLRKQPEFSDKHTKFPFKGKPKGISLYGSKEKLWDDNEDDLGSCQNSPCEHICLPRANKTSVCICSMGYHIDKNNEYKCKPEIVDDEYLLISDYGKGNIYQLHLNHAEDYSVLHMAGQNDHKVNALKIVQNTGKIFWSSRSKEGWSPHLRRSNEDGTSTTLLIEGTTVKQMDVDPRTMNVYFIDSQSQQIKMLLGESSYPSGSNVLTIVTSREVDTTSNSGLKELIEIDQIAVDPKYNFLYWITKGYKSQGQLWRSDLDGQNAMVIINALNWPRAITVGLERKALFIADHNAVVHQISLLELAVTTVPLVNWKQISYDLSVHFPGKPPQIVDMKVLKDNLYYVTTTNFEVRVAKLKFTREFEPVNFQFIGLSDFFQITSIDFFSREYAKNFISTLDNPCSTVSPLCEQFCIPVDGATRRCTCAEDFKLIDEFKCVHVNSHFFINKAPKTANCPADIIVHTLPCQIDVPVNWTVPSWQDDQSKDDQLKVTSSLKQDPPMSFGVGSHVIRYEAEDEHGSIGVCQFTVTVQEQGCENPTFLPGDVEASSPMCINGEMAYNLTCKNGNLIESTKQINIKTSILTNVCLGVRKWSIPDLSVLHCPESTSPIDPETYTESAIEKETSDTTPTKRPEKPNHIMIILIVAVVLSVLVLVIACMYYKKVIQCTSGQAESARKSRESPSI